MINNTVVVNQDVKHVLKLPYPGEVLVKQGDLVTPNTFVARSELIAGVPTYLNVLSLLNIKITKFEDCLNCAVGDFVKSNTVLARYKDKAVKAPFKGWIEYISTSNGYILLRQLVKKNENPKVVEVTKELGIRPSALKNVIQVKVGENVVRKQTLAGDLSFASAPMAGAIEDINFKDGTITIKAHYKPTELKAGINGYVTKVIPNYGVEIETKADIILGTFGAGTEVTGKLAFNYNAIDNSEPTILVVNDKVTADMLKEYVISKKLRKWNKKNIVGIIAGSIDATELVKTFGDNVYEGVTGQEEYPLSLIITNQFGNYKINDQLLEYLQEYKGAIATMYPACNNHPPIKQPKILVYHK